MTGDERATEVEPTLRSYGISVESIDRGDPLAITYMTAFPGREVHHGEIGRALNALIDRAEEDAWDPVRVEGTVVRSPGDVLGTWHAEAAWFDQLIGYGISETEFSSRVLDTLTHVSDEGENDTDRDEDTVEDDDRTVPGEGA
ncbi:hypothetical protein [Halorubrum sp. DTA46]|uniref:hypothetical protein n=1 Tax=Halorubrum sp. DTA46 TaxID=3402162 RepID=UPI003AACD0CC